MISVRTPIPCSTILFVFALLWAAPPRLDAQTVYYVSPSGNDASAGTQAQPFRTIQHAANLVNPGDAVVVEDGTYTAPGGTACSGNPVLCLGRSGSSTAPVTFRAANVGGAKLYGQNGASAYGIVFNGASYVTIDGFEIYDFDPNSSAASAHGIVIQVGHHIVLSRLHIHDIGRVCTDTSYGMTGVFVRVPNVTITRSMLHDIGRLSAGEQGCQPSTAYYQNHDHGLYIDGSYYSSTTPGASNMLISNNIFYRHQHGWAIQLYPGTLSSMRILNNTFALPNPYLDGQILIGASTSSSVIANNIFYQPKGAAISYYSGTQNNLQALNNIVYGAALFDSTPSGTTVSHTMTSDPLLVNVSSEPYDLHLQPGSPAVGAGLTFSDVTVDYDGNPRPSGAYDIGAYQLVTIASTGTTTPSVVATPTITPNGGTFSGPVQVTLATTTTGATIRYTTNGTMPGSSSPIYTGPFTLGASATVVAQAFESGMTDSGVAEATFQLSVDSTPPTVAFTSPADGSTVFRRITIAVNASDNVGVVRVQFLLDGALIATDTSRPYSTGYNFNKTSNGAHTLSAVARDAAGNATTTSITVYR